MWRSFLLFSLQFACSIAVSPLQQSEQGWLDFLPDFLPDIGLFRSDLGEGNSVGVGLSLLALAIWVTLVIVFVQSTTSRAASNRRDDFTSEIEYYSVPERREDSWLNVLDYIRPESLDTLTNAIRQPSEQVATSTKLRNSISNSISEGTSNLSNLLTATIDASKSALQMSSLLTGGIERVASDTNFQDCLLQTVCYLSAPSSDKMDKRYLKSEVEGRRRRKKAGKKIDKNKSVEDLSSSDCEVFECTTVTMGHNMLMLYRKVTALTDSFNSI